jgi:hypothetical protein
MKDFAAQDGKGPFADSHARRKMQSDAAALIAYDASIR